jgi:pimeloyl-ACP methyl ester carboxylesterase
MSRITVGTENDGPIEIHYEDHGKGDPVVHGTEDRILPLEATAARLPALVPGPELVTVEGGPHNIGWTHPEEVNAALLEFLHESESTVRTEEAVEVSSAR